MKLNMQGTMIRCKISKSSLGEESNREKKNSEEPTDLTILANSEQRHIRSQKKNQPVGNIIPLPENFILTCITI